MKRFKFDKPLVESPYPPESKNVLWVDINESTGSIISIKEFKKGDWVDIVSNQQLVDAGVDVNPNFPEPNEIYYRGELIIDTIPHYWNGYRPEEFTYPQVINVEEIEHPKWGLINKITFDNPLPEEFPWYMFSSVSVGSEGIVAIWLPKHTKSIPYAAFYQCFYLNSVFLPEGLVSIGEKAFLGCGGQIQFNYNDDKGASYFPSTLRLISDYALSEAFLGDIRFLGILDPCTSIHAFSGSMVATLYMGASESFLDDTSLRIEACNQRASFNDDVVTLAFANLMAPSECLLPGTQILVDVDGSTKSVEDIMVGDTIITYNNGQYVAAEVDKVKNVKHTHYIDIIFEDDTKISISTDHALLTEEGWKSYRPFLTETPENVQPFYLGDKVLVNGKYVKIAKIILYTKPDTVMYNIGVKGHNNYIANGVCVYECSGSN